MPLLNPFKKHGTPHYPEVLIPLADGHAPDAGDEKDAASGNAEGSPVHYTNLTLEALRAEVESDIAVSGHDTVYDRTSREFLRPFIRLVLQF